MHINTSIRCSLIVLVSLTVLILSGCVPRSDTCSQGDNMTNPRLVDGLEMIDGEHKMRITWDQGTEKGASLPKAYFEAVRIEDDLGIVESVGVTNDNEITIIFK